MPQTREMLNMPVIEYPMLNFFPGFKQFFFKKVPQTREMLNM